jgi:hypothetical protein
MYANLALLIHLTLPQILVLLVPLLIALIQLIALQIVQPISIAPLQMPSPLLVLLALLDISKKQDQKL